MLPRAVDVQIERTEAPDTETPRTVAPGSQRRASCSPSTSRAEGVDDPRVLALFERLHDEVLDRSGERDAAAHAARRGLRGVPRAGRHHFEDVDYFALVGPTGAGKSTVIDAICFALYGSVPRYGDERLVSRAVSVGKPGGKGVADVRSRRRALSGDARRSRSGGQRQRRPKPCWSSSVAEEGAPTHLIASKAREMRPAVEQLLGLPFAHFIKCVVLPQGEFARFLHDEPAKRQDLLSRLLDLDVYELIGQQSPAGRG